MSQWTHVSGTIRFDGFRSVGQQPPDLGSTVGFDDPEGDWDACDVPCGSEGSLQYQIIENPHLTATAAWVAVFWGDLRNFGENAEKDVQTIVDYFERIVKGAHLRGGVFDVQVEGGPQRTFGWISDPEGLGGKWVELAPKC